MPLTMIRLRNFKCFADSGEIPLAPLTMIFGRNNTGKSSILQSLLILRQTLDTPEYGPRLNLRGPLYPAGTFKDLVHQHLDKNHIEIHLGVEFTVSGTQYAGELEMEFRSDEPQPPQLASLEIRTASNSIDPLRIRRGAGRFGPYELYIGDQRIGGEKEANFQFSINRFLPLIGNEPPRRGRPNTRRDRSRKFSRELLAEVEKDLKDLRAVGAFRKQPLRRYEFHGRVPEIVDSLGENVVNALIEDSTRRKDRGKLIQGVNRWLKKVGRVRLLPLRRISRTARIFEVRLRDTDSGRWANFADVGFGIGQAFPVFVEGLRTPPEGIFLVQEPEIHLHPDAQLLMADFLVDLARTGKHVIAETHSENFLLRIRHSIIGIAENGRARRRLQRKNVSLLYVHKSIEGASHVQLLRMDELGQINNWPKGFMEEATGERIAIMEDMAKRTETSK